MTSLSRFNSDTGVTMVVFHYKPDPVQYRQATAERWIRPAPGRFRKPPVGGKAQMAAPLGKV